MRPDTAEWVIAAMAIVTCAGTLLNVVMTLRVRNEIHTSIDAALDRVAGEYKREDVCLVEMNALRANCR